MLRSTFLHVRGIGPQTEADLWRRGIRDWGDFPAEEALPGIGPGFHRAVVRELAESEQALSEGRVGWFSQRLPEAETWRLYPAFSDRIAYLDIETTGLSPYEGIVTVVTIHGAGETRTFVADDNLEELPAFLGRFPIVATFNGKLFDIPFLQFRFPEMVPPSAHIDLRFVLYRLGYAGGLKRIEKFLGLGNRAGVEGIDGRDAVRLWEEFRRGRAESLERLVRYNRADTVNLQPLLEFASGELSSRLLGSHRTDAPSRHPVGQLGIR